MVVEDAREGQAVRYLSYHYFCRVLSRVERASRVEMEL